VVMLVRRLGMFLALAVEINIISVYTQTDH
jgi:hypothetical protein